MGELMPAKAGGATGARCVKSHASLMAVAEEIQRVGKSMGDNGQKDPRCRPLFKTPSLFVEALRSPALLQDQVASPAPA